ncbi:MAG: endonuclease NucS [Candidatus Jordarchaeales archaeon]|nr:endonuclease NucS [Candidatus Jordarchaeia archaeon]
MNKCKLLLYPSLDEAIRVVDEAMKKGFLLLLVGLCRVDYRGRASSSLDWGERLVIIKRDGSILVHRAWDAQPVNWQPSGSVLQPLIQGRSLTIRGVRLKPRESLEIEFEKVFSILTIDLIDEAEFAMHASEKDMQRAVMANPELIEEGLKPVIKEKEVEPGFIDVYAIDKEGNIVVVELKRRTATSEDVLQLLSYVGEVKKRSGGRGVRGILAAPSASRKALLLLEKHGLEFRTLTPQKCAEFVRASSSKRITDFF